MSQIQREDRERNSNERQKESPESKIRRQEANRIYQAKRNAAESESEAEMRRWDDRLKVIMIVITFSYLKSI